CEAQTARSNAVRLSPEITTRVEPSSWSVAGAAPGNLLMVHSACLVTPGSEEYGERSQGFLRELGRPCRFHRARRLEIPPTNSRLIHGSASGAGGDEQRTQRWYRQAKETKRGEMSGRESQRLIVPSKRGTQTEGPRRGKEVPSHEPLKGNMPGTLRHELCSRNDDGSRRSRIHEMRNRVRVMCKPGSVGDLGGQPPRSTRPDAPGLTPMPRTGHLPGPRVRDITFSPDLNRFIMCSEEGELRWWDMTTLTPVGEPLWHRRGGCTTTALSLDGRTLVTGGQDRRVLRWDVA